MGFVCSVKKMCMYYFSGNRGWNLRIHQKWLKPYSMYQYSIQKLQIIIKKYIYYLMTVKLNFFLQSYVVWNFIVKNSLIRNFFIFCISYLHPSVFYQINCPILIFNTFDIESWKKNCQVEIEIKTPLFIYFDFLTNVRTKNYNYLFWILFNVCTDSQLKIIWNLNKTSMLTFLIKSYRNLQFLQKLHQNETEIQLIY